MEKTFVEGKNLLSLHSCRVCDLETPISAFLKLCEKGPAFLLESAAGGEQLARYSMLGYDPFLSLQGKGRTTELLWKNGKREKVEQDPLIVLKKMLTQYRLPREREMPRFSGGAVGYFTYDITDIFEPTGEKPKDELGLPDAKLHFMQNILVFDHFRHQLHFIINIPLQNGDLAAGKEKAEQELKSMLDTLAGPVPSSPTVQGGTKNKLVNRVKGNLSEKEFGERVLKAKEYIKKGDIFQVVLSQRFAVPVTESPLDIYRRLRALNPSPYMFLLRNDEEALVGASPEMLARVDNGKLTTRPIAGTRKRGETDAEDQELEKELLADSKERAEHVMLVDLGRNDIGRVSQYGTVKVKKYADVERFSHVMHIVSEVEGLLKEGKDSLDALKACFPAGTLSGAPKVRAMEIINELEPVGRGPYGGAVGYLDYTGNMDTCITIRTALLKNNMAYIQTGAGIVADSVPKKEFAETLHKAEAMFSALRL